MKAVILQKLQEKVKELINIEVNQDEKRLCRKEILITDFLRETVSFNQENAGTLGSGKKVNEELDGLFSGFIKKVVSF